MIYNGQPKALFVASHATKRPSRSEPLKRESDLCIACMFHSINRTQKWWLCWPTNGLSCHETRALTAQSRQRHHS